MSPNIAPPTTAPTISGKAILVLSAIPIAIGTIAAIVPIDVPKDIAINDDIINIPATNIFLGNIVNPKFTVDSTAPIFLATSAKAPANIKIKHIKIILLFPAPLQNISMFFSSPLFLFMNIPTRTAIIPGTKTDTE